MASLHALRKETRVPDVSVQEIAVLNPIDKITDIITTIEAKKSLTLYMTTRHRGLGILEGFKKVQ